MSSSKTQFDFARYGKIMLLIAAIVGLFLARHAGSCFFSAVASYELGGVIDDGTNTALVDDTGIIRDGIEGDYAENVNQGAGFFGTMFGAGQHCVKTSSFHDPRMVMYGFWGLLGLGLLFLILNKIITPTWKKDMRDRSRRNDDLR